MLVADNGVLMTCGRGARGVQGHRDYNDCLKPKLVEDLITHDVTQVPYVQSGVHKPHEVLLVQCISVYANA